MRRTRHLESPAMRTLAAFSAAAVMALLALPVSAQTPSGIAGVVSPGVEPHLVQEGFVFTEGPVGTPDGVLYFSDIRPNRIYRLDTNGEISIVREQTIGANGLAVTREGDLLAAEGDGKRISKRSRDGTVTTVTEGSEGKPFLAPNDLILDAKGGIYFTDPGPRPVVPGRTAYVYYLPPGAKQPIVVQMTVFITDVRYGDRLTQLRREIFGDNFPGSALITVTALAIPEAKVEIQ